MAVLCYLLFAYLIFLQKYKTFSGWLWLFHGLHGSEHIANKECVCSSFLLGVWMQNLCMTQDPRVPRASLLIFLNSWLKILICGDQYLTLFPSNRKLIALYQECGRFSPVETWGDKGVKYIASRYSSRIARGQKERSRGVTKKCFIIFQFFSSGTLCPLIWMIKRWLGCY